MFYVLEKSSQLFTTNVGDCFIRFIPKNNNFHPVLTDLSLIYLRPLNDKKGYIICINHSESFGIDKIEATNWLSNNTDKLWVLDKKEAIHWAHSLSDKLLDINFIDFIDITDINTKCTDYYYRQYPSLPNINCLIPISKHYEECEAIFAKSLPIIKNNPISLQFEFQNTHTTEVFYQIEKNGIKADKNCYIEHYKDKLTNPEYNLYKGKLYTQYNLYTTTSRPSNTFNNINFAALNKDNGERKCYKPEFDKFIELDFQGYHPRLIGELVKFELPKEQNTYEYLGKLLNVSQQEAKELTFKQLYGGVWSEYKNQPFFRQVDTFIDEMWDMYQYGNSYSTMNKVFVRGNEDVTRNKLFNYIVQSTETFTNVLLLKSILSYLNDKQTKLVLYTYDAFLFDYCEKDGDIFTDIIQILQYPVSIKQGKTYHGLEKI